MIFLNITKNSQGNWHNLSWIVYFHVAPVSKRNKWNTLSWVAFLIAREKFSFNLISCLKFIYIKWSIIQHDETSFNIMVKHKSVLKMLSDCFSRARTVPGTRLFNQFIPLSRGEIATKTVSEDTELFGMACEVNTTHKDIEIKFMHPFCPNRSYTWLRSDDIYWLPITNNFFF